MQEGSQNNFPSWSRIYEIVKAEGSKVLLPVVEPRAEISHMWSFQFPKIYPSDSKALSFPNENFSDLNEASCLTSQFHRNFPEFEFASKKIGRLDAQESRLRKFFQVLRSGLIWSLLESLDHVKTQSFYVFRLLSIIPSNRRSRDSSGPATTSAVHQSNNAILGVSTIQAHGQSTSNVSNHIDITYLAGALHYHLRALEIHNSH